MSGPATVPFAIAALYESSGNLRVLYAAMAILCAGYTSYRLWLNEHVALEAERHRNQFPNITAAIDRVYIVPPVIRGAKVFVLVSVHNLNAAMPSTVKRYELTMCIAGRDYFGKELPVGGFRMVLEQPRMLTVDSTGLQDGPLIDLNAAVSHSSPLRRGVPVKGWLSYGYDDLPPWPLILPSEDTDVGKFDTSVVLSVTLTVVDAFDGRATTSKTPPWRNVGTIDLMPQELSIEELAEEIVEYSRAAKKEQRIPVVALDEGELASQFTQTRSRISKALLLLQQQGRAKKTSRPESWAL